MAILARPDATEAALLPDEIAFLAAEGVAPQLLVRAAELGRASGTDAATALLHAGLMSEEAFYRALARTLGTAFLEHFSLSEDTRYPHMLHVGAAPLAAGSPQPFVAAPRGHAIGRLIENAGSLPAKPAITTPTRLRRAAFARHADEIARAASDDLASHHPEWSCRPGPRPIDLALAGAVIALCLVLAHLPTVAGQLVLAAIQLVTLAMLTVRLSAIAIHVGTEVPKTEPLLRDDQLPVYTVIAALHREAKVVPRLVHALAQLDYPALWSKCTKPTERSDEPEPALRDALGSVRRPTVPSDGDRSDAWINGLLPAIGHRHRESAPRAVKPRGAR